MRFPLLYIIIISMITSCNVKSQNNSKTVNRVQKFDEFWYKSKAEINLYTLQQARYGEIHDGEATLVFVTEPFNTKSQVKSDNGMGKNVASVLKLNQARKFYTGVYPYSTMTSSFTPVEQLTPGNTEKVTNSVQEWCGQVFMQMNKKGNQYDIHSYSYFESEGDERSQIKTALLEDEIFSLIRLNPEALPTGELSCFPATVFLKFMHKEIKNYKAFAQKDQANWQGNNVDTYTVKYPDLGRTVIIYYDTEFPYQIQGWEETYSALGGKKMTTTAVLQDSKMLDYWNKNAVQDSIFRLR